MSEERPEGLSREERSAYSSLKGPLAPPGELEDRVTNALVGRGLIRRETGGLAGLLERLRAVPLVPRLAVAGAALAVTFVMGVEVGKRAGEPSAREAVLEPKPAAVEEEMVDDSAVMVATLDRPVGETSYVRATAVTKPMPDEEDPGDFRPYPLDGEFHPYSVSR